MQFIHTTGWEDGIAELAERLVRELAAGKQVLWLVSGGSNISASVQVMDTISSSLSQHLSVMLADERYGKVGHRDSNWAQLMKAGFAAKEARLLPVLQTGLDFEATAQHYADQTAQAFKTADAIIAQLGMGEDGHIAGILPDSTATGEQTSLVAHFRQDRLSRLTLTFPALRKVSAAYAFAFGPNKKQALLALREQRLSLEQQPAQILKQLGESYVYNDQLEDI